MEIKDVQKVFDSYVKKFDMTDYDIAYKYRHSYRVKEISKSIAQSINLTEENILLAEIIGLLHDIGRFKQKQLHNSFSDFNIDHGDLGAKVLFEENVLGKMKIESKYYDIISFAITNHNKLEILKTSDKEKLLHTKIVRDADKLDIYRAYTKYKDRVLKETKEKITKEVSEDFFNNHLIDNKKVKNENDKIIQFLSFIYNINFKETINIIKDENIIDKLFDLLEQKELFKSYFEHIKKYVNERNE